MRSPSRPPLAPTGVLVIGAILFTAIGLTAAAFGPALPELAQKTGASLTGIGALVSTFYFGSVTSLLASGVISDRIGQRPLLAAGMIALSSGALGISLSPTLGLVLAAGALAGLGFGTLLVSTNLLVAAAFTEGRASALNFVAVFGGVGSFCSPAIAAASLKQIGSAIPVFWACAFVAIAALPMVGRLPSSPAQPAEDAGEQPRPAYRDPLVLATGLLLFLCVGVENDIGAWTATYLGRTASAPAATAALLTSGYWLALTVGRAIGAALGRRIQDVTLLRLCLAGAAGFGLLLALSVGQLGMTSAAVLGLGLCIGPLFPTTVAVTTRAVRSAPGAAISLISAMGHGGAMVLPWLGGTLLERVSPAASVAMVAAVTATTLLLHMAISVMARASSKADLGAASAR